MAEIKNEDGACALEFESGLLRKKKEKLFLTNKTWIEIGKKMDWGLHTPVVEDEKIRKNVLGISVSYSKKNEGVLQKTKELAINSIIYLAILYFIYYSLWQFKGFEFTLIVLLYFFTMSVAKGLFDIKTEIKNFLGKENASAMR